MHLERLVVDLIAKQLAHFLVLSPDETHFHLLSGEVQLRNVRVRADTINAEYASASPVLVKKGVVGLLRVQFKPLRVDAINVLVEDVELEVEPRPSDSDWWTRQAAPPEPLDRSQQLALLDPEGAEINDFAKAGSGPSRLQKFALGFAERLTAAVLGALRVEVKNVKVRVVIENQESETKEYDGQAKDDVSSAHMEQEAGERKSGVREKDSGAVDAEASDSGTVTAGRPKEQDEIGEASGSSSNEPQTSSLGASERDPGSGGSDYVALEVAFDSFVLFEGRHGQNGGSGGGLLGAAWTAIFGSGGSDKGAVSKHTQLGGLAIRLEEGGGKQESDGGGQESEEGNSSLGKKEDIQPQITGALLNELTNSEGNTSSLTEETRGVVTRALDQSRRSILLPNEIDTVIRINKLGLDRLQVDARTVALELDVQDLAALASIAFALSPPKNALTGGNETESTPGLGRREEEGTGNTSSRDRGKGTASIAQADKGEHSDRTQGQDADEIRGDLSAAVLRWQKAFRMFRQRSQSTKLHSILEAGAARRRYLALYTDWLQAIGWNEDDAARQARERAEKEQPREAHRIKSRLEAALKTTEESIPVEAIVIARKIARSRLQERSGGDAKAYFGTLYYRGGAAEEVQAPSLRLKIEQSEVYQGAKAGAKVLYAVLWGLLSTLWTIIASPYNGFVAATHVMQKPRKGDTWADDDVTPAELAPTAAAAGDPSKTAHSELALSVSFHVGTGSVTFATSAQRQQGLQGSSALEESQAEAIRLSWSRFSLSATQSGGQISGAYLARVTLGSIDCSCISLVGCSPLEARDFEVPPLESVPSGGILATIFGRDRRDSETQHSASHSLSRWEEGPEGHVPLFVSGCAPEWKTAHPNASKKLLGMGAFCNRGLGRNRRLAAGTSGGFMSRLARTSDPGSSSLSRQPSSISEGVSETSSQAEAKPFPLMSLLSRPFFGAPSLPRAPSLSRQPSSISAKQGPSPEEEAASERRRQRREQLRARLAANRPFILLAAEVTKEGLAKPGEDDSVAAVTCGASVGRLTFSVGLELFERLAPVLSEAYDLAAFLGVVSTAAQAASAATGSLINETMQEAVAEQTESGGANAQAGNTTPADALSETMSVAVTALGPSICAAVPGIRLDVSAVIDAPRLIITGGPGGEEESPTSVLHVEKQNSAILADCGQLAVSVWPVSSALHQQERRRRASQQESNNGRADSEQGLSRRPSRVTAVKSEKEETITRPHEGVWGVKGLEVEAWDRQPPLPKDVVGGKYSQRFKFWNSAHVALSAASLGVAEVSTTQLASLRNDLGDRLALIVEPLGAEVDVTLLKEVGSALFGGGVAASVAVGLKVSDLTINPVPDKLARAAHIGVQLAQGATDLLAEVMKTDSSRDTGDAASSVGESNGLSEAESRRLPEAQSVVSSAAKANQVELFSLACYVHAATTKARLSETDPKQSPEEKSHRDRGREKEKDGPLEERSKPGKSRAHERWVKATGAITKRRKETSAKESPRAEQNRSGLQKEAKSMSGDVALEGAWLRLHLSERECQADVAAGLGAVRMTVDSKPESDSWRASSDPIKGSQLSLSRCSFEASLGEILQAAKPTDRNLEDQNSEEQPNRGSQQSSSISAALQVGTFTFLEAGEAGSKLTQHVKQAMTGAESLTLAVEVSDGLQAVSVHSTGGLFLIDSGAVALSYTFLTEFATVLVSSISAGLALEENRPPSNGGSLEGEAPKMYRAGVRRSVEEGIDERDSLAARDRSRARPQREKRVKWADQSPSSDEEEASLSQGQNLARNREPLSEVIPEAGTLQNAKAESSAALLEMKATLSVKGVTMGLLRSVAVDPAPAGAVLLEFDTTAAAALQRGDLTARLDVSRVALLGVIPPPQELGSPESGSGSTMARLFRDAEQESANSSAREQFGATVGRGSQSEGRPSEEDLSPALQGGRQILECLRLAAKVRSVPSLEDAASNSVLSRRENEQAGNGIRSLVTGSAVNEEQVGRLVEEIKAQRGAWEGDCSVSGADLAVTTGELQLLIAIATPLYTALYVTDTVKPAQEKKERRRKQNEEGVEEAYWHHLQDLPDGAVVAIKDEQEQLFMSVEPLPSDPERYRVGGTQHYTLAGERALFKVKRHPKYGSGNKDQAWFSLLSLHARHPASGEPFRLHFNRHTNQAGVGTTSDSSFELFRVQCVRSGQLGESFDDLDLEEGALGRARPRAHLVNKKAGKGLGFLEGVPMFTSKLGNAVKIKVLSAPLEEDESSAGSRSESLLRVPSTSVEDVAVALTNVPRVRISVAGGLKATVLHEAAGGAHILPLLRLGADDIGAIVTSGSRKTRAYAELVTTADYFESQSSQWGPILKSLTLEMSYRGRSDEPGNEALQQLLPFKIPTSIYLFIRDRVDAELNQVAMDTLLFLVGALGLAGPYVVKYSPTQANQCRVENKTGVELLCRFNDEEGGAARSNGVVRPFEGESFLIRHIASRRDPRPALASSGMVLQLQDGPRSLVSAPFGLPFTESDVRVLNLKILNRSSRARREPVGDSQVVLDVSMQTQVGLVVNTSPLLLVRNTSGMALDVRSKPHDEDPDDGDYFTLLNNRAADDLASAFQRAADADSSGLSAGDSFLSIRPLDASLADSDWSEDIIRAQQTALPTWADQLITGARSVVSEFLGHKFDLAVATISCRTRPKRSPEREAPGRESAEVNEMHFLVKTQTRKVPCKEAGAANTWVEQREIVILPTMRLRNALPEDVAVRLHGSREEADEWLTSLARRGAGNAERRSQEGSGERANEGSWGEQHGYEGRREESASEPNGEESFQQPNGHPVENGESAGNDVSFQPASQNEPDEKSTSRPNGTVLSDESQDKDKQFSKQPTKKFSLAQAASFFRKAAPKNSLEGIDGMVVPGRGQEICLHGDPANAFMSVYHPQLGACSEPVSLADSGLVDLATISREATFLAGWGSAAKKTESNLEVRFGREEHDRKGLVGIRVARDSDGVLKLSLHVRYALQNDSNESLECVPCEPVRKKSGGFLKHKSHHIEVPDWPSESRSTVQIRPSSLTAWMYGSETLLVRQPPRSGSSPPKATLLDMNSLGGASEINLRGAKRQVQLGMCILVPSLDGSTSSFDLTRIVQFKPRYRILNDGPQPILVAQDGFERDAQFITKLAPGESAAMHAQEVTSASGEGTGDLRKSASKGSADMPIQLHIRVRPESSTFEWSGRLCASALGTFYLKSRPGLLSGDAQKGDRESLLWLAEVAEDRPSLVVKIRPQSAASVPYRIENNLRQEAISFCQKGVSDMEMLEPGRSVDYVWDDLALDRRLSVYVNGTQLREEVSLDKLRSWKAMRSRGGRSSTTFLGGLTRVHEKMANVAMKALGEEATEGEVSYQVYADGPTRVLRISDQAEETSAPKEDDVITMEAHVSVTSFAFTLLETVKQRRERDRAKLQVAQSVVEDSYSPLLYLRVIGVGVDYTSGEDSVAVELKLRRADIDVKWEGAPKPVLLRPYAGFDDEKGDTLMHLAVVGSTKTSSPLHLTYFSFLLQAIEVNVDEDTLVKLVAFARTSLAPAVDQPSTLVYFERFEVHPIKIVASFQPGSPDTEGDSAQEALRGMLHSLIRLPAVKNQKVELNGVLLTHALLTYSQLATKCAVHYYWYAMRAISLARGAEFLPPSFVSLFDDSASVSLDVFFDPKAGAIDKTVGMFNLLRKEVKKRGGWTPLTSWGASTRIFSEQAAGWGVNVARVLLTEVSDSLLKGAETQGVDGLWRGFQRGVMHAAMADPMTVLQAALKGSGTHKIQLDKSLGTDEAYIEGYLQAMLDRTFRQDYLRVKLSNDQVVLKNLPPNSRLTSEIIEETRNYLIGEGLIEGDSHAAAARSRRFRGEQDNSLLPIARALAEQLVIVIVVHKLHARACALLHLRTSEKPKPLPEERAVKVLTEEKPKKEARGNFKSIVRKGAMHLALSSGLAWIDGRLCRRIPNSFVRKIVSAFILSFVTERRI